MNNLNIIIGREVKERVAKKSFIFTTLLTPLFMILLMALPSLIMLFSHGSKQKIVTIDKSELVLPALLKEAQDNELVAIVPAKSGATQQELINDEDYDGVLVIGPDIVSNPSNVTLYSRESSTMDVKDAVSSTVAEVVRELPTAACRSTSRRCAWTRRATNPTRHPRWQWPWDSS